MKLIWRDEINLKTFIDNFKVNLKLKKGGMVYIM